MPLNDFNESQDPEVLHTRRNLAFVVHDALRDRRVTDARKKSPTVLSSNVLSNYYFRLIRRADGIFGEALYHYPPDLHSSPEPPPHITTRGLAFPDVLCSRSNMALTLNYTLFRRSLNLHLGCKRVKREAKVHGQSERVF